MKLHIEGRGLTARGYRVSLDGMDISNSVRRLELVLAPGEANQAEIILMPDEITVSAETLASLTAIGREAKLAEEWLHGESLAAMKADWLARHGRKPSGGNADPGLTEKDPGCRSFWARVFPWLW